MATSKPLALYAGEIEELRSGDSFTVPWSWLTSTPTTLSGYGITDAMPQAGGTFTGLVALSADPSSALHAATKQYVDGLLANLGKRQRVRAATTANITIATALNNGDTLDGVTLATGDLALVKNQTAPEENGVYVVGLSPARATEFDTYNEHPGSLIAVAEGTANADTLWLCTSNEGGTLGTTAIAFSKMVVAGELLAANNLSDVQSASAAFNAIKQAASDTVTGVVELATTIEVLTGTDAARATTADAIAALWEKGTNVASAATVSLGEGGFFHITGTTTITDIDFATAKDGRFAWVIFDGALTLTHNATTLTLPGGANITTAAGDRALFIQDSADNVYCMAYIRSAGSGGTAGKQTAWIPGRSILPRITTPAASGIWEAATNDNTYGTLDFDPTTQEYGNFATVFPKRWNKGTLTFKPVWSHPSTATNFGVVWSLAGIAISNDDSGDVAFGTVQTSIDTGGTTNDIYVGPESAAITIAGIPALDDLILFQITRVVANASDTLAVDARLHGIILHWTSDAENDA